MLSAWNGLISKRMTLPWVEIGFCGCQSGFTQHSTSVRSQNICWRVNKPFASSLSYIYSKSLYLYQNNHLPWCHDAAAVAATADNDFSNVCVNACVCLSVSMVFCCCYCFFVLSLDFVLCIVAKFERISKDGCMM